MELKWRWVCKMNDPKVLTIFGTYDGCAMWRVIQPTLALNKRGYPVAWRNMLADDINRQTDAADILVLCRIYFEPDHQDDMEEWFAKAHHPDHYRLVVIEFDDDVVTKDSKQHTRIFHKDWTDDDAEEHRQAIISCLRKADAITTTTEPLAALYRSEIPETPVYVLPNAIRWEPWRRSFHSKKRTPELKDKIVIGWTGGSRVQDDLAPMIEAWKVIAQLYDNVHFIIAGPVHPDYANALPSDRITLREWVKVDAYPHQYADFDIACCPLAPLPFNYMKSPCKAFEAGAAECAVVASPVVYSSVIDDGKNGFIAYDVRDWTKYLSRLVEDHKLRRTMAKRWSHRVEQRHNLDRNCWMWADAWRKIMAAGPKNAVRELSGVS